MTAGAGGSGVGLGHGSAGQAQGTIMFLHGAAATTMNVTTGTQTIGGAGAIAGDGGLSKTGAGTLAISGANANYSGTKTITGGTVAVGAATSLGTGGITMGTGGAVQSNAAVTVGNAITLNAGGGIWNTNGNDTTLSGNIGGTGAFTKSGAGALTLSGANSYSGGTTVSAGSLVGDATSLQGAIVNNAAVTFNQAAAGTYSGDMSGTGSFTKSGAGNLNLTGTNSFTGATTVNAGTLRINGSLTASAVTVNTGATLGGTATIGNNVTIAGGTWAPGNSIGTQIVTGNVSFGTGSTYQVEVNTAGQADRIEATGTATINSGAAVRVQADSGTYDPTQTYTILRTFGGVTGTFGSVTTNLAFLMPSLSYTANNVTLSMVRNNTSFAAVATAPNHKSVAAALDLGSAGGQMTSVVNAVTGMTAAQADDAFHQFSGEANADMGTVGLFAGQQFMGILGQQIGIARGAAGSAFNDGTRVNLASLGAARFSDTDTGVSAGSPTRGPWNAWMSGVGVTGKVDGSGSADTLNYHGGGAAAGIDKQISSDLIAGIAAGYPNTSLNTQGASSSGTVNSYQGALYGSYNPNQIYVQGLVGYAYNDNAMTRTITTPGINSIANGSTHSNQFLGAIETGYALTVAKGTDLSPFVGIQSSVANQASFTETGAGALNLSVESETTTSVRSILGFQVDHDWNVGLGNPIALLARAGWAREYASTARPMTAAFVGAPGAGFTVDGAQIARDSAILAVGATARLTQSLSFLLRYDGDLNGADYAHAVTGRLSYTW